VWDGANQIAGYTYNGAGQRIEKVTQSGTKIFHYDLKGHLIAETDEDGEMIAEYIYLGDQLLAMITKPGETEIVSYFHNDHLGTPLILTNDNETIVWKAAYTPFGGADISVLTVENPFKLSGQYYDPETGLHYNYFRYYHPYIGRYITPDPIGLEGGINLFAYVRNPINALDPWGLSQVIFDRATGKIYIIPSGSTFPLLSFPAGNNVTNPAGGPLIPGSHGPAPTGTFPMGAFFPTGNDPNSKFGIGFIPIYLPPQIPLRNRPGVGLHSGRRDECDPLNRCGVNYWTEGCIRTTDDAMRYLQSDPPTTITIDPNYWEADPLTRIINPNSLGGVTWPFY